MKKNRNFRENRNRGNENKKKSRYKNGMDRKKKSKYRLNRKRGG